MQVRLGLGLGLGLGSGLGLGFGSYPDSNLNPNPTNPYSFLQGEYRYHCSACDTNLCGSCYDQWKRGEVRVRL